jgi:cell division protein FtsI/penicillin-binding protein 2
MVRLAKQPTPRLVLLPLVPAFLILSYLVSNNCRTQPNPNLDHQPVVMLADQDVHLQSVATNALGTREGAIVVIDPQTGHLRAVVNAPLAFQSAFPPGSTIKPFTTLAGLRSGVITKDTRIRCAGKQKKGDAIDACSHPSNLDPFGPVEALAYSCNHYFATVGERLEEDSLAHLLSLFGFGQATGIDAERESTGILVRGSRASESTIGEGPLVQVTPIQLAMAYAALVNGGRLLIPTQALAKGVRAQLRIEDQERSILMAGMRGAVIYGTAEKADLASLPAYVVGKTGTSTQLQGFRSQGWFVGVAFADDKQTRPWDAQLLVVVFMKKAHGSEAAEVAAPIFEAFARAGNNA